MHRFFLDGDSFKEGYVNLTAEISRQIKQVLRLKSDDKIILLDNKGYAYESAIREINADVVCADIINKSLVKSEPLLRLGLYISLTNRDNFELILEKCTETGVSAFHPFVSERTTVADKRFLSKQIRWQSIIREAAEQADRGFLPVLYEPQKFSDAIINACANYDQVLIAWEECDFAKTIQSLEIKKVIKSCAIFIGPKGGFSKAEIESAGSNGIEVVSLGKRILKVETAAIVSSYFLNEYFEN